MSHQSDLIATDILAYLDQHEQKDVLRLLTCGNVDDGKSTLIGRLLHDSRMIYEDQLEAIRRDSAKGAGTRNGELDLALLVDGLQAEREQGITIDVAYRYFSTATRKFIIADTPGHEQYTRNMATGASTCDAAVILVDARNGVLTQTRRHSYIASLLGIKHIIVAVNKMDLVDFEETIFRDITNEFREFSSNLRSRDIQFIPISALHGDNVVEPSERMPWYRGSTLMYMLANLHIAADRNLEDMRFPVQYVNRPSSEFRGYSGTIASGVIRRDDAVMVLPSRKITRVVSILTFDGELEEAFAPMAVTLTLGDELDISRGDMIVPVDNVPHVQDLFEATLVWMAEQPLIPGHEYLIKHTTQNVQGWITQLRYQIDINTMAQRPAFTLKLNEIGRAIVRLSQPIVIEPYRKNRAIGSFILIDRLTNATVGAGMIHEHVDESDLMDGWTFQPDAARLRPTKPAVTETERATRLEQRPVTVLLTGIEFAGKSTIASAVERRLFEKGKLTTVIDGHDMRLGLSKDLGFTTEERAENLRRGAELARLMNDAGLIALCAFVAPGNDLRDKMRHLVGPDRFLVVHVHAPVDVCRARDTEGYYARADRGEIPDLPGISAPFEAPTDPDLLLDTHRMGERECVDAVCRLLEERGFLGP